MYGESTGCWWRPSRHCIATYSHCASRDLIPHRRAGDRPSVRPLMMTIVDKLVKTLPSRLLISTQWLLYFFTPPFWNPIFFPNICYFAAVAVRSIVMSMSVCLSVCLSVRWYNSKTTWPNFTKFFACCPCPWLGPSRCDTLYTSGFMDDVIFTHNDPMTHHVYSEVAIKHDKHNSRDFNQILLRDKDRKYSLWIVHRERSPLYDCFVSVRIILLIVVRLYQKVALLLSGVRQWIIKEWDQRVIFLGLDRCLAFLSVLWRCFFGDRKDVRPAIIPATYSRRFRSETSEENPGKTRS